MDSRTRNSTSARFTTVVLLAVLLLVALTGTAHAAVINVTTTADAVTNDSFCSLREAVAAANANAPGNGCNGDSAGPDTINLGTGTYKIETPGAKENSNATGDFDVTSPRTMRTRFGTKRSGAKSPERASSNSRKKPSYGSVLKMVSAIRS